ncbi:hypothetical protein [Bifidobacterium olomucense]|uniref:hypothetical protein n=1 Tax=Bifidobacterium olomucense TaxID=2675324 RepID=UPI00145CECC8|nr:hypothetical protein [Bifidobacterium sp. DSM 109959]
MSIRTFWRVLLIQEAEQYVAENRGSLMGWGGDGGVVLKRAGEQVTRQLLLDVYTGLGGSEDLSGLPTEIIAEEVLDGLGSEPRCIGGAPDLAEEVAALLKPEEGECLGAVGREVADVIRRDWCLSWNMVVNILRGLKSVPKPSEAVMPDVSIALFDERIRAYARRELRIMVARLGEGMDALANGLIGSVDGAPGSGHQRRCAVLHKRVVKLTANLEQAIGAGDYLTVAELSMEAGKVWQYAYKALLALLESDEDDVMKWLRSQAEDVRQWVKFMTAESGLSVSAMLTLLWSAEDDGVKRLWSQAEDVRQLVITVSAYSRLSFGLRGYYCQPVPGTRRITDGDDADEEDALTLLRDTYALAGTEPLYGLEASDSILCPSKEIEFLIQFPDSPGSRPFIRPTTMGFCDERRRGTQHSGGLSALRPDGSIEPAPLMADRLAIARAMYLPDIVSLDTGVQTGENNLPSGNYEKEWLTGDVQASILTRLAFIRERLGSLGCDDLTMEVLELLTCGDR